MHGPLNKLNKISLYVTQTPPPPPLQFGRKSCQDEVQRVNIGTPILKIYQTFLLENLKILSE